MRRRHTKNDALDAGAEVTTCIIISFTDLIKTESRYHLQFLKTSLNMTFVNFMRTFLRSFPFQTYTSMKVNKLLCDKFVQLVLSFAETEVSSAGTDQMQLNFRMRNELLGHNFRTAK